MLHKGWELFIEGGWIMWPLLLCAVVGVAVALERFITINRASTENDELMDKLRKLLLSNRVSEALELAERTHGPVAALLASGIRNQHLDHDSIERSMEELALREAPLLNKRLGILDTVVTMAPLLGLLGTITGMMAAFNVVAGPNTADQTSAITGGVAEALIATATGLGIAITILPLFNYLTEKVQEVVSEMETRATELLNILAKKRELEAKQLTNQTVIEAPMTRANNVVLSGERSHEVATSQT
jgi:biopolymer transport protein ExbB